MNRSLHYNLTRMKGIIKKKGEIHKFELVDQLGISLSSYEKLASYAKYHCPDFFSYDKKNQKWISEAPEDKEDKQSSNQISTLT